MHGGYIGNSGNIDNPFCKSTTNCKRQDSLDKQWGGTTDFQSMFKGPTSLFGGIEYQTPYEPFRLKLEYDANDYMGDYPVIHGKATMPQDSKFNYGALYRLGNWGGIYA